MRRWLVWRRLWCVVAILLTAILVIGCLLPSTSLPNEVQRVSDVLLHGAAFASVGAAWFLAGLRGLRLLLVLLTLVLVTEGGQAVLDLGRQATWSDALADGAGALVGWAVGRWAHKWS